VELKHLVQYLHTTRSWTLKFSHLGENWEDLWLSIYADAGECGNDDELGRPGRAMSGYFLVLEGANGTYLPLCWQAKRQTVPTSSSGEAECIAWAVAVKAGMRMAVMLELCRHTHPSVRGFVDNEALRISVLHGNSKAMGHLKKQANICFDTLRSTLIVPTHISGDRNTADLMTKILGRNKIRQLCERMYRLDLAVKMGKDVKLGIGWDESERDANVHLATVHSHHAHCVYADLLLIGDLPNGIGCTCIRDAD
jgi:hypothetical protein